MPPFPLEYEHVYDCFRALSATRGFVAGMSGGISLPITFAEIEAFQRQTGSGLTAFEVELIRRVDDAVLAVWGGDKAKPPPTPGGDPAIPASNPGAIRDMLRGVAVRKAAEKKEAERGSSAARPSGPQRRG